jgi:stage III sporulation protein AF
MDSIREWVRNLTLLIILASFLELLVPQNSMKRYIKLVMGLVILLGILNPVFALLRQEVTINVGLLDPEIPRGASLSEILRQGETFRQAAEAQGLRAFQIKVEREAERQALTVEGVAAAVATARVALPGREPGQESEILEIQMAIQLGPNPEGRGEGQVAAVEPIRIGEIGSEPLAKPGLTRGGETSSPDSAVAREVRRVVASHLGVPPERVKVAWGAGE